MIFSTHFWRIGALAVAVVAAVSISSGTKGFASGDETEEKEAPKENFKEMKSPVPYSKRSLSKGRQIYMRYCTECHGPDGKAQIDVIADATDLTSPKRWYSGTTEGEVFRSIRDGAGVAMPPFKMMLNKEEDMWHLVNYIRSWWPEDMRPELEDPNAKKGESTSESGGEKQ